MVACKTLGLFVGLACIAFIIPTFASPTAGQPRLSPNSASLAVLEASGPCSFCLASSIRDLITPPLAARTTYPAVLCRLLQIRDNITHEPTLVTVPLPTQNTTNEISAIVTLQITTPTPTPNPANDTSASVFPEIANIIDLLFGGHKRKALSLDALTNALSTIRGHIDNSSIDWDFNATELNLLSRNEAGCAACIIPEIATIIDRLVDGLKRDVIALWSMVTDGALKVVRDKVVRNVTPEQKSALAYVRRRNSRVRDACIFCALSDVGDLVGGVLDEGLGSGSKEVGDVLGAVQGKIDGLKNVLRA